MSVASESEDTAHLISGHCLRRRSRDGLNNASVMRSTPKPTQAVCAGVARRRLDGPGAAEQVAVVS